LIDTPPVLSVADARVLSRLVDAVVLVIRSGRTRREMVTMALSAFEADGTPVLGTVLNDWTPRTTADRYYSPYYPDYYRNDSNG
jgi:Mrp family chromosome partitioning ATPase